MKIDLGRKIFSLSRYQIRIFLALQRFYKRLKKDYNMVFLATHAGTTILLKNRSAAGFDKRFSSTVIEDWIVYSPSVIYSVSKLIEILSDEADHVVIQTPAYDAFYNTIKDNKRIISRNELIYRDGAYSIDFTDLEEKLAHPKRKCCYYAVLTILQAVYGKRMN